MLGNCAMLTEISRISVHKRQAWRNESTSNWPVLASKNFSRLSEDKLHAVSSWKQYLVHGLIAFCLTSSVQVCHSLIVVSNCTPGSAHDQAAYAIWSHSSRARSVLHAFGSRPSRLAFSFSVRQYKVHGPSLRTASMNSFST